MIWQAAETTQDKKKMPKGKKKPNPNTHKYTYFGHGRK